MMSVSKTALLAPFYLSSCSLDNPYPPTCPYLTHPPLLPSLISIFPIVLTFRTSVIPFLSSPLLCYMCECTRMLMQSTKRARSYPFTPTFSLSTKITNYCVPFHFFYVQPHRFHLKKMEWKVWSCGRTLSWGEGPPSSTVPTPPHPPPPTHLHTLSPSHTLTHTTKHTPVLMIKDEQKGITEEFVERK